MVSVRPGNTTMLSVMAAFILISVFVAACDSDTSLRFLMPRLRVMASRESLLSFSSDNFRLSACTSATFLPSLVMRCTTVLRFINAF